MAAGGAPLDLYVVLGVDTSATKEQVSKAYRKLALRNHPDKVPPEARPAASERFREIARAYEVLRDPSRRRCYDETGVYDGHHGGGPASEYDTFFDNFFGDQARGSDGRSSDYTYYSLSNYDRLTLKEDDLPPYMHDIVKVGLNYLALAVADLEEREVVFLRHQRVDILYVMVAYFEPLTQKSFDDGYIIHYYDNPLQAGITPCWSDQNVLDGQKRLTSETRNQRVLTPEQFTRRKDLARAALTAPDPQAALEEKYAAVFTTSRPEAAPLDVAAASASLAAGGVGSEASQSIAPVQVSAPSRDDSPCCLPPLHRLNPWRDRVPKAVRAS